MAGNGLVTTHFASENTHSRCQFLYRRIQGHVCANYATLGVLLVVLSPLDIPNPGDIYSNSEPVRPRLFVIAGNIRYYRVSC